MTTTMNGSSNLISLLLHLLSDSLTLSIYLLRKPASPLLRVYFSFSRKRVLVLKSVCATDTEYWH